MEHNALKSALRSMRFMLMGLSVAITLSGCTSGRDPGVDISGGLPVSNCDAACEAQRAADRQAAADARAASAAEAARVQALIQQRDSAVRALDNAIADFIHRRPSSVPFDDVRSLLYELQNLRSIMASASLNEVAMRYASAQELLDRAYDAAVTFGMVDPHTVGQRNANETWWYISS